MKKTITGIYIVMLLLRIPEFFYLLEINAIIKLPSQLPQMDLSAICFCLALFSGVLWILCIVLIKHMTHRQSQVLLGVSICNASAVVFPFMTALAIMYIAKIDIMPLFYIIAPAVCILLYGLLEMVFTMEMPYLILVSGIVLILFVLSLVRVFAVRKTQKNDVAGDVS